MSLEDHERPKQEAAKDREARRQAWLAANDALSREVLDRRGGEPIDVDEILRQARGELEATDDWVLGCVTGTRGSQP